jgi:hypothetical protein
MKPAFARGRAKTTSQPSGVTEALDCGPNAGEVGRLGRRTLFGIAGIEVRLFAACRATAGAASSESGGRTVA